MESRKNPTKKQQEILNFLSNFIAGHGYCPSYREIMKGLGYNSTATVADHVNNLIKMGYVKKTTHRSRSLEVVDLPKELKVTMPKVAKADEKWLVDKIENHFTKAENAKKPSQSHVDELYVLIGSLKIMG